MEAHLLQFSSTLFNPFPALLPSLVETQQSTLPSSFDQHVRLCNKFSAILDPGACNLNVVEDFLDMCRIIFGGN
jgi:hypothetical protein